MFVSVLDLPKLISEILHSREISGIDGVFLFKLKDCPAWFNDSLCIRVKGNETDVMEQMIGTPDIVVNADMPTLVSCILGTANISRALITSKLRVQAILEDSKDSKAALLAPNKTPLVFTKGRLRVMETTQGTQGYSIRYLSEGDEPALTRLLKGNLYTFSKGDYWAWKYRSNPAFDPSLVIVAENNGEIVGCNHWLARDLRLSSSLTVRAALGADVLVHPQHRGQGIGTQLLRFMRTSGAFKEKGIVITCMFTGPNLNRRLYEPTAGYIVAPNSTVTYRRLFNCRELKEKLQKANGIISSRKDLQKKLEGLNMSVLFKLKGAPIFSIDIESKEIRLKEGDVGKHDVVVEGDFHTFFSLVDGNKGVWGLVRSWIAGELNIRKGMLKVVRSLNGFRALRLVFGEIS